MRVIKEKKTVVGSPGQQGSQAVGDSSPYLPIHLGGTGVGTEAEAYRALEMIPESSINQPHGPLRLDENGRIPLAYLPAGIGGLTSNVSIKGKTYLHPGEEIVSEITNYDSFTEYRVETKNLTATINHDYNTIRIRAGDQVGLGVLTINGDTHYYQIAKHTLMSQVPSEEFIDKLEGVSRKYTGFGSTLIADQGKFCISTPTENFDSIEEVGKVRIYDTATQSCLKEYLPSNNYKLALVNRAPSGYANYRLFGQETLPFENNDPIDVKTSLVTFVGRGGEGSLEFVPKTQSNPKTAIRDSALALPETPFVAFLKLHVTLVSVGKQEAIQLDLTINDLNRHNFEGLKSVPCTITREDGGVSRDQVQLKVTQSKQFTTFEVNLSGLHIDRSKLNEDSFFSLVKDQPDENQRVNVYWTSRTRSGQGTAFRFTTSQIFKHYSEETPGYYRNVAGEDTVVEIRNSLDVLLETVVFKGGVGDMRGVPVLYHNETSLAGDRLLYLDLDYKQHPQSEKGCRIHTPLIQGESYRTKMLEFGLGKDTIDRVIEFYLKPKTNEIPMSTSTGTILVEFSENRVVFRLNYGMDIQNSDFLTSALLGVQRGKTITKIPLRIESNKQEVVLSLDTNYKFSGKTLAGTVLPEERSYTPSIFKTQHFGQVLEYKDGIVIASTSNGSLLRIDTTTDDITVLDAFNKTLTFPSGEKTMKRLKQIKHIAISRDKTYIAVLAIAEFTEGEDKAIVIYFNNDAICSYATEVHEGDYLFCNEEQDFFITQGTTKLLKVHIPDGTLSDHFTCEPHYEIYRAPHTKFLDWVIPVRNTISNRVAYAISLPGLAWGYVFLNKGTVLSDKVMVNAIAGKRHDYFMISTSHEERGGYIYMFGRIADHDGNGYDNYVNIDNYGGLQRKDYARSLALDGDTVLIGCPHEVNADGSIGSIRIHGGIYTP